MSKIALAPAAAGTAIFTIESPGTSTNRTLTLPDDTGTIVTNSGNQAGSFTTLNTSGQVVFNDAGADVDFRVEGDTNANLLFVDASADAVGIGTSSPSFPLDVVSNASSNALQLRGRSSDNTSRFELRSNDAATHYGTIFAYNNVLGIEAAQASGNILFNTNSAERMRIDSSGNLLVGTTSTAIANASNFSVEKTAAKTTLTVNHSGSSAGDAYARFGYDGNQVGSITILAGGGTVAYNTSSDYRLKENIAPMTGALAKVLELNPVTYTWKASGYAGEGFIAHELQAVCPEAVTGEKDAIEIRQVEVSPAVPATYDEEGNELTPAVEAVYEEREVPVYQGVDTSFLVATLTAAIQELKAELDEAKARIAALENA